MTNALPKINEKYLAENKPTGLFATNLKDQEIQANVTSPKNVTFDSMDGKFQSFGKAQG